jgi:hypothetical protein
MSDGGILPNDRVQARDASPLLSQALDNAVERYDAARREVGGKPLTFFQKGQIRPAIAAAVEGYLDVISGGGHVG